MILHLILIIAQSNLSIDKECSEYLLWELRKERLEREEREGGSSETRYSVSLQHEVYSSIFAIARAHEPDISPEK